MHRTQGALHDSARCTSRKAHTSLLVVPCQRANSRAHHRPRVSVKAAAPSVTHQSSVIPSLQRRSQAAKLKAERMRVISLISANVEADALVQAFETIAGRSAMIGFFVALVAEAVAPQHSQGLFGGLDNTAASVFAAHGVVLITFSAILASMSGRKMGMKAFDAVLASMTALQSQQKQGRDKSQVAEGVDRVFEKVLNTRFIDHNMLQLDDFI